MALLAAPAAPAGAATFHVATTGDDGSGDGSVGNPWATITHALDSVPDESLVLVAPGDYSGRVTLRGRFATGVTVRAQVPYQARLRHNQTVVICYECEGIALEGFDVAHSGPGAGALVMQIQDGDPDDGLPVGRVTLRDNIFHDSFNNDIVKVNNAASDVLIAGNMFYNQAGSDEHMDINSVTGVVIEDNVLFNDFAGSGRSDSDTSSFVVIKDSNGASDNVVGSSDVTVRRNVFLHFEGSSGQGFVRVGEDGTASYEADGVLIENNLMLGNNTATMRSPIQFQGVRNVTARANTISGNQPALEYGFRIVTVGANQPCDNIHVHNNIWSDPTGTMGAVFNRGSATTNLSFDNNLFWNDGNAFPTSGESIVEVTDDAGRVVGDPLLGDPSPAVLPRWLPGSGQFADGSSTIREVFENLVALYGTPAAGSAALDAADAAEMPTEDILGNDRSAGGVPDIGAVELPSCTGAADGTPCDDNNECTSPDTCQSGVCVGTNDDGAACDDGNECTAPDACSGGTCVGVSDDGAPCDDGNECTSPDTCQSGVCVGTNDDGAACDDGDACTFADQCSAGACGGTDAPRNDCDGGVAGSLRLRDSDRADKDLLQWQFKGAGGDAADLGDPVSGDTDYALCLWDSDVAVPLRIFGAELAAASLCDGRPCWKAKGATGFGYKSGSGAPDGVRQLKIKTGSQTSIKLKAGREALVLPSLPLLQTPDVTVQLSAGTGACWQTVLPTPADRNTAAEFRDKR